MGDSWNDSLLIPIYDDLSRDSYLNQMQKQIKQLKDRIASYRLKTDKSDSYLQWMEDMLQALQEYAEDSEMQLQEQRYIEQRRQLELIEIIKKQALIIDAANIIYPTINQSLASIYDIWLSSKGRIHDLPVKDIDAISVQIATI